MIRALLCIVVILTTLLPAFSAPPDESPLAPYIDPAQLDCPWPKHSFYKQPWRGFQETRRGDEFLQGIGINYHSPGNDEVAIRLLAETGIKTFRIEVGFGSVKWDESGFNDEKKIGAILTLCQKYGIRPTLLLNAHHGAPCPMREVTRKVMADAPVGAKTIMLDNVADLAVSKSGLNPPKEAKQYWAAAHLFTAIDPATKTVTLSRALTAPLKAGESIKVVTLKYAPLYPVGNPLFDETAAGWVKYALMLCDRAAAAQIADFDLEIWNELSFGSNYTQVRNYYDKNDPAAPKGKDFLNPGGCAWELAHRTVDAVKAKYPKVRAIWGFSNTTFHHCKIENLPPATDGQSYHPYGTGSRKLPEAETHKDKPEFNLEGFTPTIDIKMPEGWAQTWIQTEGIMRHLNAPTRLATHPPKTERFYHYMTEHGVLPAECGIKDEAGAWDLKALCATRAYLLWMNKGVDVLHYFQAADKGWSEFGIMPAEVVKKLPADAKWDDMATPPMKAIRNLTSAFKDSTQLKTTRPLTFEFAGPANPRPIFEGDAKHPPLTENDVLALLPWQITEKKFIIAAYVMSYDATRPVPETTYRIAITEIAADAKVTALDVISGKAVAVEKAVGNGGRLEMRLPLTDRPRLIVLEEVK